MSIIETKGWYNGNADGYVNNNSKVLIRRYYNNAGYGYGMTNESDITNFRPVIWN